MITHPETIPLFDQTIVLAGVTGRVLVVDDDPGGRQLLTDWLTMYGHKVTAVADGAQALRAVAENPPDVIILDVMMPGMDGFQVCEHLKNNPATAVIPVLLLTALSEKEDRLRGLRAGATDLLSKPADLAHVLLRVRNAIHTKRLHDELQAKYRDLRGLQNLKENLLQMMVHDLRTPLAALDGYLQLLQLSIGPMLTDRPTHYLRQALSATNSLAQQIDLLLDIHRLEEGRMPVLTVPHDLTKVVQDALQPLQPLFGDRRLQVDLPATPVTVCGDPTLLGRVVTNLVGNAIAFTSPHAGEITVRSRPAGDRARVEIADNGPGIDPAHHQVIFEKFRQLGETTRARSSGLGLAFCKLAVEAQSGCIGVHSQPGAGSRFWFEVPTRNPAQRN